MNNKKFSSATAWVIIFVFVIFASLFLARNNETATTITFNKFQKHWINNEIKSFEVKEDKMTVSGNLKDGTQYETIVPFERLNQFISAHDKNGDVIEKYALPAKTPMWLNWIPTALVILMFVIFWFMFMQQSQGGGGNRNVMNFGKSRAKMATPDKRKVTFDDVAGAEEEKEELAEIVDFLKQPKRYIEMGARIPKGVLLVGPPGTGKTLLAKAIAGEAGVPFFSISGSDFVEMFVGVGASRVRDLFDQAKKNSPCIIFIDEIDAVGRQRGAGLGGGHDEREQTLNQLLVEMDGFGANEGIIMVAATNRPDILDPALLRPGRFDRQILVGAPDVKGREEILKVHSRNKPLSEEVKLDILAKRTPGFTGADLENLMNESALLAVRKNKKQIEMEELEEAVTRVIAGPEKKSRVIDEEDRRLTAYHEAGHAVVMKLLPHSDPVHQISIVPRGMAGGYTMHLPEKDRAYMSKSKLEDEIVGLLGGRVAEKLIIGDISTGAKNDIERSTTIAKKMVMDYGMSEVLGPIAFGSGHEEVFLGRDLGKSKDFSEEIASKIDKEVKRIIDTGYERAQNLLMENINKLHAVAQELLEKEKLEAEEFEEIFQNS
ncbi:ATP-dependent zinc metalloprotease FtsH [Clostridium cochlearium]|jgi:cell division protease FtsH|uniref:ATP-dependent zinc metalloprotease FtsH n=1 Tax=Clostridium cochlearium TaxID=1494 RepID=A0A240B1Y7_CLOCO|nr:ATP-dependent zinc metalloprotease FtsH [Clostridium cochlearium]MBV1818997.1 ATP-dependent zinc metalloprotease FtsH [Bacteroidales bacterium MSK.15.36]NSJ91269.1 ATP-dependent metallopeptidase FtsH/Yme1/Tma family protein [Coprococcus sp. MSK.21.13]MBE6065543.1 ATP-dependent metallopeptidase FtsH/Yme1/Tma family protein [Clostridium cochlearium]MBU5270010.1 ATP-dependent zinc metalloprotease FtsH [Clostridium cochlearium]MCG4572630.1 ATP-dependent zinc metalloprotease FtsH [Clostridium co